MIKRLFCLFLAILSLSSILVSCSDETENNGVATISFSQANSIEHLKDLDGKKVQIIGYMSTLSPVNGKFMYLMNLPYQSCPFCVPNTTQLSNTIAVYAKNGKEFEFTDKAILTTGTLEFGNFEDDFGYKYAYRIKDANYEVLDTSKLSGNILLWQQLASTDVISEVYNMYDYLNFITYWPTYTLGPENGKDYVWPSDAITFITEDGKQYNYGFKPGYFDAIIAEINEIDPNAFSALVTNITEAKAYAELALKELIKTDENGNYVTVDGKYQPNLSGFFQTGEYTKDSNGDLIFGDGRSQYKLTNSSDLEEKMDKLYYNFSNWLSNWEL